ncbi:methyltransferase [Brevundimonas lutea]|uniref:methyltransferase n=1 Tax=Brevundimonas lutea TaxID=2293980 RepID=UPI0013CEB705|nr:methyltransferase [Brevundimonas lutea]
MAGRLYLHSAPSRAADDVFLGPDTYRYARFLRDALARRGGVGRLLDIGVGAGVGAMVMADRFPGAEVWGSDVNARALDLARVNARHNAVDIRLVECSGLPPQPPPSM